MVFPVLWVTLPYIGQLCVSAKRDIPAPFMRGIIQACITDGVERIMLPTVSPSLEYSALHHLVAPSSTVRVY